MAIREGESIWQHRLGKAGVLFFVLVAILSVIALLVFPFYAQLEEVKTVFLGAAVLVAVILAFALKDLFGRRNGLLVIDLAGGMMLLTIFVALVCLPAMERYNIVRILAETVRPMVRPNENIISVGYREPTLVFYANQPVHFTGDWAPVAEQISANQSFLCLATSKKMDQMPPQLRESLAVIYEADGYMPSKGGWITIRYLVPAANSGWR